MNDLPVGARPHLASFNVYHPGMGIAEVQRKYRVTEVLKLASNENMLGPSPRAVEALRASLSDINLYPDTACIALREALATKLGVSAGSFFVGNGAVEIIYHLCQIFLDPGDEIVTASPSFSAYPIGSRIQDAIVREVPLVEDCFDLPAMGRAVGPRTKLLFIANPNNPTGTIRPLKEVEDLLVTLPPRVIVVLDEAYSDFVLDPAYHGSLELIGKHPNLVVLRSLSKSLGIAGLRVGYAVASDPVIRALVQVQVPFHVNLLAQKAAIAALDDEDYHRRTLQYLEEGRAYLHGELHRLGVEPVPTHANFVWIRTALRSDLLFQRLVHRGVIVRPGENFGAPHHSRVTIGLPHHNQRFVQALEESLNG